MKSYIYAFNNKPTRNGWSYRAVRVFQIIKNQVVYLGERHYTAEDELQAVCIFLSETQKGLKVFPRGFIPPKNAKLTADRKRLKYSNGYTQNYVEYLEKEARYNTDKKKQIIIRAIGGTISDLGKKHGNYTN